jgi:hypothetical protein
MKVNEIERLLKKYLAGETSLTEEKQLTDFFCQGEVPTHLWGYAAQFRFFAEEKEREIPPELTEEQLFGKIDFTEEVIATVPTRKILSTQFRWGFSIAASIGFLIIGFLGGKLYDSFQAQFSRTEIAALRNDVKEMKQLVMLSMLEKQSPSERIKAVNYAEEFSEPDAKVVSALVSTLNTDDNVNVRLAAANALARFANAKPARDALIESLEIQTDPIIQISLINLMVDLEEKRAIAPLKKLLNNKNTTQVVKEEVRKGLGTLI